MGRFYQVLMDNRHHTKLSLFPLWLMIGGLLLVAVAVGSLLPVKEVGISVNDKWLHIVTYLTVSAWFSLLVRKQRVLLMVYIGLTLYGLLMEYLQGMTGYRMLELADAMANSLGALLGLLVYFTPLKQVLISVDRFLYRLHG